MDQARLADWTRRFMGRVLQLEELALRLEPAGAGLCRVQITQSPYGSQAGPITPLRAADELARLLRGMEAAVRGGVPARPAKRHVAPEEPPEEPGAPEADLSPLEVGDRLFRALFSANVLETFLKSLGRAESRPDAGLRIRLVLDPAAPEIGALPWELLYRADTRDFLGCNPLTPLVRYLEVPRLAAPAPLADALRILVVAASPRDQDALDLGEERQRLLAAWGKEEERVAIEFLDQPTLLGLRTRLMSQPYHVLHFMGHGDFDPRTGEGVLLFEDAQRNSAPVSGRLLAEAVKDSRWLRLVLLNACDTAQLPRRRGQDPFSGVASALLLGGVPAVIAMQYPISDDAALVFSQQFYAALAAGFPVDSAAAEARLALRLSLPDSWEWATPALYMSVPDGRILRPAAPAEDAAPAATAPAPQPAAPAATPHADTAASTGGFAFGGSGNTFQGIQISTTRKDDDPAK